MAKGVSARLRPGNTSPRVDEAAERRARGRKFGFTVGGAFVVLGGLAQWRGSRRTALAFYALGGVLIFAARFSPGALGPVERAWMGLAHAISRVTTPIMMGVLYFGAFTILGALRRMLGRNTLVRRPSAEGSYWVDRPANLRRSDLERQF